MSARRSSEHSGGRGKGLQLTFTELLGAHPYLTWVLRRRVLGWPSALCNTWRTHSSCEPQSMVSSQCQVTRAQILCPVRTIGLGVRPARKPLTTWARTLLCLSCLRAPENSLGEWGGEGWGALLSSFPFCYQGLPPWWQHSPGSRGQGTFLSCDVCPTIS